MDPLFTESLKFGGFGVLGFIILRIILDYRAFIRESHARELARTDAHAAKLEAMAADYRKTAVEIAQAYERRSANADATLEAVVRAVDRTTEAVRPERRTQSDDKLKAQRG